MGFEDSDQDAGGVGGRDGACCEMPVTLTVCAAHDAAFPDDRLVIDGDDLAGSGGAALELDAVRPGGGAVGIGTLLGIGSGFMETA